MIFQKNFFICSVFLLFLCALSIIKLSANNCIVYTDESKIITIGDSLSIFEDSTSSLSFLQIQQKLFSKPPNSALNLGISSSTYWIKLSIRNLSKSKILILQLPYSYLDQVDFFYPSKNGYSFYSSGDKFPFYYRLYKDPDYIFKLQIPNGIERTYYLRISNRSPIQLLPQLGSETLIQHQLNNRNLLSGLYFGIMLAMILYNLFIFFVVKDYSYIFYVIYILLSFLTQTGLQGFSFQYLYPNNPEITLFSLFLFPSLCGIAALLFMKVFLRLKFYSKTLNTITLVLIAPFILTSILPAFNLHSMSYHILDFNSLSGSFFMFITSILIIKKGYKPARYFLAAWTVFLVGVISFILKDYGILPYNNFTRYTMQVGTAIETIILSIALAARITDLKREKETLIEKQKNYLKQMIQERTVELQNTKHNLKEFQNKLIDADKMVSLGVLTAGIAHEINNPINFISANISPLKSDLKDLREIISKYEEINTKNVGDKLAEIQDLKQKLSYHFLNDELNSIVLSIEYGAKRTTSIVKSLLDFSHTNGNDSIYSDLNDNIKSTLLLLKNETKNIDVVQKLNAPSEIKCDPNKLNQMFLNLFTNAINAINSNHKRTSKGKIEITTFESANTLTILISDNGVGFEKELANKIYEPFFTTKELGKGTGLGLSIVYQIIKAHRGEIAAESTINLGTTFKITLPLNKKDKNEKN